MNTANCQECDVNLAGTADAVWAAGRDHSIATGHKVDIHISRAPEPWEVPIWGDVQVQSIPALFPPRPGDGE